MSQSLYLFLSKWEVIGQNKLRIGPDLDQLATCDQCVKQPHYYQATQIVLDLWEAQDLAVDFQTLNINGQHCLK